MASVDLNALTEVQNPASTDNLLLFNETSNVATRIDYDKLAEAILNKTRSEIGGVSPISAIAALNSSGIISGHDWLTEKAGKNDTNANLTLEYRGKVAHISFHSASDTFEESEILFSVPDGYRPNVNHDVVYYISSATGVLRFGTNGNAEIWLPANTKGRIYADFTYILK